MHEMNSKYKPGSQDIETFCNFFARSTIKADGLNRGGLWHAEADAKLLVNRVNTEIQGHSIADERHKATDIEIAAQNPGKPVCPASPAQIQNHETAVEIGNLKRCRPGHPLDGEIAVDSCQPIFIKMHGGRLENDFGKLRS